MRKVLPIILPAVLIALFSYLVRHGDKDLLIGIYLLFPNAFIIQGKLCSDSTKNLIIGLFLSAIGVLMPISIWYHVADMIPITILYTLFGIGSFILSRKVHMRKEIGSGQKVLLFILSFFFPIVGFITFISWFHDSSPEKRNLGKLCLVAALFLSLLLLFVLLYGWITYVISQTGNN